MQALSKALLDMRGRRGPGGASKAASRRRAERNLTVRDLARRDDPDFDRNLQQQIADVGPTMQREHEGAEPGASGDDAEPRAGAAGDRARRREYARSDLSQALDARAPSR